MYRCSSNTWNHMYLILRQCGAYVWDTRRTLLTRDKGSKEAKGKKADNNPWVARQVAESKAFAAKMKAERDEWNKYTATAKFGP